MRLPFALLLPCALAVLGCEREPPVEHPKHVELRGAAGNPQTWSSRRQRIMTTLPGVEQLVAEDYRDAQMPSLAAAVLVDGELVWWRGYGSRDLQRGGPVTAHTVYRIGSVTKTMTGMALLKLRDEGVVDFDAPATHYLPELGGLVYPTADSPVITIRHLVTHTSGLPRLGDFDYGSNRKTPVSDAEVLHGLRGLRLPSVPGTKRLYSNFGFALLGVLISRVVRGSYRDYVTKNLLAPLGMRSFYWDEHAVPHDLLATGYTWNKGKRRYQRHHHWRMGSAEGMGGLYASLDDMVRYIGFQMTAWPPGARADQPPLSNATLRESHVIGGFAPPSIQGTGIGWAVADMPRIGHTVFHTGATASYATTVLFFPEERLGAVLMTNSGHVSSKIDALAGKMLAHIVNEVGLVSGKRAALPHAELPLLAVDREAR